jgi:DNA-directed RNA polymerase subunit RPC12/RpoP
MRCPYCGNEIIREYPNEKKVKVRTSIVVFEEGKKTIGKCTVCHNDVNLPVRLDRERTGEEKDNDYRQGNG